MWKYCERCHRFSANAVEARGGFESICLPQLRCSTAADLQTDLIQENSKMNVFNFSR